ncbi:XPG i-region domain-containing protein [Ditylenchus destructor]|uniref:Exonuclease 1 n=1 Tax=Ditylenchus destructor TaxID=166010 RepID=A0AAD4MZ04_9BILA|nr:XPG i-region domain-containing protein [Ditylenchus destructor]
MGIPGLLSSGYVKKACRQCLLHKGVLGCVEQIRNRKETNAYVQYVRKYVNAFLALGCHVILVFDGEDQLPAKKGVNDKRRSDREKNQQLGDKLQREGLTEDANRAFRQSVSITRDMVENTIQAFQNMKGQYRVDCLVAPYEADAQIAYLLKENYADVAVTEDSDLIVYGCETKSKLPDCLCAAIQKKFEFKIFRRICILAGCDYLQGGLKGIGLKNAELFFAKISTDDMETILFRLPLYLNKKNIKVDKEFVLNFIRAENTFLYQVVFDPRNRKQTRLNPCPSASSEDIQNAVSLIDDEEDEPFSYAGKISFSKSALRKALGNTHVSGASIMDKFVLTSNIPDWSIWSEKFSLCCSTEAHKEKGFDAFTTSSVKVKRLSPPKHSSLPSVDGNPEYCKENSIPTKRECSALKRSVSHTNVTPLLIPVDSEKRASISDDAVFSDDDCDFIAESPLRLNAIERKLLAGSSTSKMILNPFAKRSENVQIESTLVANVPYDKENEISKNMKLEEDDVHPLDESIIFLCEQQGLSTSTPLEAKDPTRDRKMPIRSSPYFLKGKRTSSFFKRF